MTLNQIAASARGRRLELGLSQADLAKAAHVSRKWVSEFEKGKPTAELGLVLRLLDALGMDLQFVEGGKAGRGTGERLPQPFAPSDIMAALEESLARARAGRPTKSRQDRGE